MIRISRALVLTTFAVLGLAMSMKAQAPAVIRGQITDTLKRPLANVEVVITAGDEIRRPKTNKDGKFVAVFPDGPTSFLLVAKQIGFLPATWLATLDAQQTSVTSNAKMTPSVIELPTLMTTANASRPSDQLPKVLGGSEVVVDPRRSILRDPSDLNELMASLTGLFRTDSGMSLLGLPPDQNSVLVGGLKFDGGLIPPDAVSQMRLSTSTSDVSHSQNSAAQLSLVTARGGDVVRARVRASWIEPRLSWKAVDSSIEPTRTGATSGGISGPLRAGTSHFNLSWAITDNATRTPSLLHPIGNSLQELGILTDTVARLVTTLNTLGVVTTLVGADGTNTQRRGVGFLTLDAQLSPVTSLVFTLSPSWTRSRSGGGIASIATTGAEVTSHYHQLGAKVTTYFGGLAENLSTAISMKSKSTEPTLRSAGGSVLVGTSFADGRASLTNLSFGGGGQPSETSEVRWELRNEVNGSSPTGKHQFQLGQSFEIDWAESKQSSDNSGRYFFSSLADLVENRAASFTRRLGSRTSKVRSTLMGAWLGDIWGVHRRLGLQGGLRLDYSRVSPQPAFNHDVAVRFGLQTNEIPEAMVLSGRVGFAWMVKERRIINPRHDVGLARAPGTNIVSQYTAAGPQRNDGVARNFGAGYRIFGAIDFSRGAVPTELYLSLLESTGLPNSQRTLSCSGEVTPFPIWSEGGAWPMECRDGIGPVAFALNRPSVTVLHSDYRAPSSLKVSLGFSGLSSGTITITPDVQLAFGFNQASRVDRNFQNSRVFTLEGEEGRPIFVPATEIDSRSGLIAPGAGRVDTLYAKVSEAFSDLRSQGGRIGLQLKSEKLIGSFPLSIEYHFQMARQETRGRVLSNPLAVSWGKGWQGIHQIALNSQGYRLWWFSFGGSLMMTSGSRYTPSIAGDVNGDGLQGDAAFIPDPRTSSDPDVASQVTELLNHASSAVAKCLRSQLGKIAAQGSCREGWQTRLDLRLQFEPPPSFGLSQRLRVTTRLIDAGGALVRLLGLQHTALGQASANAPTDTRFAYVTGFDPVARQFRYRVNQLFGQPVDAGRFRSKIRPFQVELGAEFQFGALNQNSDNISRRFLDERGQVKSRPEIRRRFTDQFLRNPAERVLMWKDSLGLVTSQVERLRLMSADYENRITAPLDPLLRYIEKEGRNLTSAGFAQASNAALVEISPLTYAYGEQIDRLLTAEQRARLLLLTKR